MRILLTGHHGYIGSVMAPLLRELGHEVVGLDSDLFVECVFPGTPLPVLIPSIRKDLRELEVDDLEGFDAVLHLAGLSNDPLSDINPGLTEAINLEASVALARLAKQAGVERFIFSSSCSTYGAAGDDFLDETAPFNPVTAYGISKVRMEEETAKLASTTFVPTFLRNATACGVSPRLRLDLVLNNLVASAFVTGKILMLSDGTPWRPIVHIRDICGAFIAVLDAPADTVRNQAFNVGTTEENFRIRELAQIVAETVPGSTIEYAKDAGPDKRCYRVDCSKIRRVLPAFEAEWDARRSARELYAAYQVAKLTQADLDGPRYKRLGHLRQLMAAGTVDGDLRRIAR